MQHLYRINDQIGVLETEAASMGIQPDVLRTPDGNYALTPLLVAKAQVLHALTLLQGEKT
jgi:hypothetical protein